ncbi:MAG: carboxypeptidase regulatory-like domain-containing protein [Pyrinomonadaceae bacterium]
MRAQSTTGTVSGYVTDQNGAAVTEAAVTATLVQQNVIRSVRSSDEGFYDFAALPPGEYTISVEKTGFQRVTQTGLMLSVNQNLRLDLDLKVGDIEQQITVTAETPLVDTRSQTISGLVDDRRVVDLPINGRNVIGLARIIPGVINVRAPQQLEDARSGPAMNVNGGRSNMNLFTLNGGYFNNPSRNTGMNYPPPDAVQEFRILTHNFSAEYGRNPGAQVLVVTKSGTNDLHGSLWEFLRNDALNARSFFDERRPIQKQNQFGFAVGGPVKKDKLFAFGSYQGLRDRPEAGTVQAIVPSAAQRSGDFSGLTGVTLQNPVDVNGAPFTDAAGQPCVANNIINSRCISPVAQNLLNFVPVSPAGVLTALAPSPRNGDMLFARLDWNASNKHTLYGHYFRDHNNRTSPFAADGNIAGYIGENFTQETNMLTINDTYTFGPTLINQLTGSYLRSTSSQVQNNDIAPSELGINLPPYVPTGGISFDVGGQFNLGSGFTTQFLSNSYQVRDTLSWLKGKHSFKFGGEWLHLEFLQAFIGSPSVGFTGSRSGDPVADLLLGAYDNLFLNFGNRVNDLTSEAPSVFFQDEFKIHRRLSLTYGLRYEPYLPWKDKQNRINTIVPGAQSTVVPDAPRAFSFRAIPAFPTA